MAVDPAIVEWLKNGALFVTASDPTAAAKWGSSAGESEVVTALATDDGAAAEAARAISFLVGPLVEDEVLVDGLRPDLHLQPIAVAGDRLGYAAEPIAFVIGYREAESTEQTILTVLRVLS